MNQKPGSLAGFLGLWFRWFGQRIRRRLMPRDLLEVFIEHGFVFATPGFAGGGDEALALVRFVLSFRFTHLVVF